MSKEQNDLIKIFNNNPNIVTRKADKSNVFVVMNKQDYTNKIDKIIQDGNKFCKIEKDPTPQIKKKLRSLVEAIHANANAPRFPMPVGHYEPGYIYGTAKIHKDKNDPPLRPIISQVCTVTHEIAKKLNEILTPYIPARHMIKSTQEFIDILSTHKEQGYLASLDVENLFTNVPVDDTINIILDNVYHNEYIPPPNIPKQIMKSLLNICTTETPFRNTNGDLYVQRDGCSMGSALGPLFASYYMCSIENAVLPTLSKRPLVYTRYVDDIFLIIDKISVLDEIKTKFQEISVLNFTYEIERNKSLSFLDVAVTRRDGKLTTTVHTKATNSGDCINYNSIAPERYKLGVIKTFIHRAYKICCSWQSFHSELERIKQLLSNNNFPMIIIEREIKNFLDTKYKTHIEHNPNNNIILYYKNQMTSLYKQEEKRLKLIINTYTEPIDKNKEIKLIIYYKTRTIKNMFIKNNNYKPDDSKRSHVIYQYTCPEKGCEPSINYIGYSQCTLTDRCRNHAQSGAIISHSIDTHNTRIATNSILASTKILRHFHHKDELIIAEALLIKQHNPSLNGQREGELRILSIF